MKTALKITIKIQEKNTRPVFRYPSTDEIIFSPYSKAKLRKIFDDDGILTFSVWYLHLSPYNKDYPDNQIVCTCCEDYSYAREAFVKEYIA